MAWGRFLFGVLLLVGFFGLEETAPRLEITFQPDWTNSSAGEVYGWLGFVLLLVPGGWLIADSLWPKLRKVLEDLESQLATAGAKEAWTALGTFAVVVVAFARAINTSAFRSMPFTDDEWAVRFGGQILASGHTMLPIPAGAHALPKLFLFGRHGMYTSFDWLGGIAASAFADVSGLGPVFYALVAAGGAAALVGAAFMLFGRRGAILAAALSLTSPMMLLLDGTTHAQLVSRSLVSLALLGFAGLHARRTLRFAAVAGLAFGTAVITRPFEALSLLSPVAAYVLWHADRRAKFTFLGVFAVPLAVFGAYNASITGAAWVPPRFGKNELSGALQGHSRGIFAAFTSTNILWNRFGHNFIYNVIMLAVWFGGPLGVSLAAFGVRVSRVTLCLGIGVALSLLVTFAHDDPGLHVVGPIHYSEASAFLVLLAVAGARRVYRWAKGSLGEDWGRRALLGGLVGTAIAAMLLVVHHGAALRRQAEIHESVYSFFETDPRFEHSVVIAPPYMTVWRAQPRFAWTGSFVFEWQRPFPGNRVIFAYDRPKAVELLARDFPDRRFYLVERGGGGWSVTDIGIGGSKAPAETPAN